MLFRSLVDAPYLHRLQIIYLDDPFRCTVPTGAEALTRHGDTRSRSILDPFRRLCDVRKPKVAGVRRKYAKGAEAKYGRFKRSSDLIL